MHFDIQAKVNGEYVTVASGRSYDSACNYQPVFSFDAVVTDDIRIVFTKNGGIFPNLRELEVYSDVDFPAAYRGYPTNYPIGGRAVTEFKDTEYENRIYETTVRNSNPPMIGYTPRVGYVLAWSGTEDPTPLLNASYSGLPMVTGSVISMLAANNPGQVLSADSTLATGPIEYTTIDYGAWIVTAIVFVVCAAAVAIYVIAKRKKS